MISVIIPSRNEIFLNKTIQDVLARAEGEIEVVAVIDENWPEEQNRQYWSTPARIDDPRVKYIHPATPQGMRWGINHAVQEAKGDYLLKSDGHCLFAQGFDKALLADMEDNWVVIPRRYSLDAEKWAIDGGRPIRDYHYLCYPEKGKPHDDGMHGVEWPERTRLRSDPKYNIDDNMSFQGSCWFMKRTWFTDFLKGLDEDPIYGGWAQEPVEIGNKTWLGGGRLIVNKKTYYAHLHKGKTYGRGYKWDEQQIIKGHAYAANLWMNNQWTERKHDIDWLVEKFWPVPTWPENWKVDWYKEVEKHD